MPMHGIDVYGLLADYLGVTTEEIQDMQSKGKITYDMLSGALKNATKEGGRFNGAMEKQSHTLNGMISNFKDNVGNLAGDLSSGFTDAIKNILPPINNMIDRIDTLLKNNTRFVEFSKNIANVFKIIGDAIDRLSDDQLNSIIDFFVAMVKTGPLMIGIGAILPKLASGFSLLGGGIGGATSLLGSFASSIHPIARTCSQCIRWNGTRCCFIHRNIHWNHCNSRSARICQRTNGWQTRRNGFYVYVKSTTDS